MAKPNVSWDDDLLGRKENGTFLYNLVMQRYRAYHSSPRSPALCFALDADWGAGKTFFVDRWSNDVAASEHPTIHFDAWANDLSDDPLIGFLATLRRELKPWLDERPIAPALKATIGQKVENIIKHAGKAAVPAASIIAGGIVKRYAGNAFEEIADLWKTSEAPITEAAAVTAEQQQEAANKADAQTEALVAKTVEKFLETAMKAHADKQQAVALLKKNIEDLIDYLVDQKVISAPMFIFVDELDRCRPDYAIKLLEGIKHLFNARGVCFVVSTNLSQLSSAIKAVYGAEFDAYRYLKKFFSFEYMLPTPKSPDFCMSLVRESRLAKTLEEAHIPIMLGLPDDIEDPELGIATCFNVVATVMDLNLRSQRQVFEQAEAALAGCEKGKTLLLIYHFFLAAVLHKGVALFDSLFDPKGISTGSVPDSLRMLPFVFHGKRARDYRTYEDFSIDAREVLKMFHGYATWTRGAASREAGKMEEQTYPSQALISLSRNGWTFEGVDYLYLAKTGKNIRASGYVR